MKRLAAALLASTALALQPTYAQQAANTTPSLSSAYPNGQSGIFPQSFSGVPGLGFYDPKTRTWKAVPIAPVQVTSVGRNVDQHFKDAANPLDAPYNARGTGDDTLALQMWAAALGQSGTGRGFLPCGTLSFSGTLTMGTNGGFAGGGACSQLNYTGASGGVAIAGSAAGNVLLSDFVLGRATADTASAGIQDTNGTSWSMRNIAINNFYHGIEVLGGDSNLIDHSTIRNGSLYSASTSGMVTTGPVPAYKTYLPGSASIYLALSTNTSGGTTTYACPNSVYTSNHNLGGGDGNYFTEAGIYIVCVDGLFASSGHIGAVQSDVDVVRRADLNVQSVEVKGYLDGAVRAVNVTAPVAGPSGTGTSGLTAHLQIKPFQIANALYNAVENRDPTVDLSVIGADIANTQGSALLAPVGGKIQFDLNKITSAGAAYIGGGGKIGLNNDGSTLNTGTPGSVASAQVNGNQFYGVTACLFIANANESRAIGNEVNDCTAQAGTLSGKPQDAFPNCIAVSGPSNHVEPSYFGSVGSPGTTIDSTGAITTSKTISGVGGSFTGSINANNDATHGYIDSVQGGTYSSSSSPGYPAFWEWKDGGGNRWAYMGYSQGGGIGIFPDNGHSISIGSLTVPTPFLGLYKPYITTVANLPTCNSGNQDGIAIVADATSPTYRSALIGGGSVRTLAECDGSTWTAH